MAAPDRYRELWPPIPDVRFPLFSGHFAVWAVMTAYDS